MIKNIIFDWSGVINDDLLTVYNAAMINFEKFGAKRISLEEFKKEWEQPYMVFYYKYLPEVTKEEQDTGYKIAYKEAVSKYPFKAYSNIKETLKKFRNLGIDMIILSSNPLEFLLSEAKQFGLKKLFKEFNGGVHDKAKAIQEIIRRNQFKPHDTIFIGDTTHEVKAGKIANIKTGVVTWGYQNENKLNSSNPDFIIHNLKELEAIILD
jgi:phosphoglycolate phosphatase-like HAD superfamily hydrolase